MTMLILTVLGAIAALAASAFYSGAETGTYCLNRVRLRVRSERGVPAARTLSRLMERPEDLIITSLVGTNIADFLTTALTTGLLIALLASPGLAELYTTLLVTPLVLVIGGIIPKDWFQRDADRLMSLAAVPLRISTAIVTASGVLPVLRMVTHFVVRRIDPEWKSSEQDALPRARVSRLLIEGAAHGGLTAFQRDTIQRVLRMNQVRVGAMMTPRARAILAPVTIPREEFLRIARMSHFSRIPVYESSPRFVTGVVSVHDVIMDDAPRPIRDYVLPAFVVQADETAPAALLRMQQARREMGIVVDRAGACVGLFTMKDLVEEIVGEFEGR